MRKNSFFLSLLLITGSLNSFSMNGNSEKCLPHNYDDCIAIANIRQNLAMLVGFSFEDAYEMGNNALESCVDSVNLEAAHYWNN